jgi:hypothetical protein
MKYAEAEQVSREFHAALKRVLGAEHPHTLHNANNLAACLCGQGKFAEAEQIQLEVHVTQMRVLGRRHPDTLNSSCNVACTLFRLRKYAEAEQLFEATLKTQRDVLGPAHPHTLNTTSRMDEMLSEMRVISQMCTDWRAAQPDATDGEPPGVASPLPAGMRVIVQRLIAKPEHNGKHARVLSFDARTGRYAVALDDGKKLSLKVECVARALEVVILFQPGPVGIHATHTSGSYRDGAMVRCVPTAVASYPHTAELTPEHAHE